MNIKRVTTRNYGTNCFLLDNKDSAVIIDPAEYDIEIKEFAEQNKDKPNKFILLTHCHFDHIGYVNGVKEIWNCPVVCSEKEKAGLMDNCINLSGIWTGEAISVIPDITVRDKDIIQIGNDSIGVIETPGHTKGSISYILDNVIFCGDTLFKKSIGRTDLPTADYTEILNSLSKLLKFNEETVVMSGHGEPTTIGFEAENNPYVKNPL